jgi:hypothetical protein
MQALSLVQILACNALGAHGGASNAILSLWLGTMKLKKPKLKTLQGLHRVRTKYCNPPLPA